MRYTILVLAIALAAGTGEVRADQFVSNMTGTITYAPGDPKSLFAAGDHISWTLQYDRSTPMSSSGTAAVGSWAGYQMQGYALTNLVDQTTGYHFPIVPPSDMFRGGISLANWNPGGDRGYSWGYLSVQQGAQGSLGNPYYSADLELQTAPLPTLNLAKFSFDNLQVIRNSNPPPFYSSPVTTSFSYTYLNGNLQLGFTASVDSIPGAFMTPEPGSLTLFLLGALGLAARGMRRCLGQFA